MATAKDQTVHSGHTINIMINGKVVGKCQALDGDRSFGTEGVYEIGSIMPQEHVHNRYEGSLMVERFLLRKDDLAQLGLGALNEDILTKGVMTLQVVDKYTGKSVRSYHGCSVVSYRESIRANAICGENATVTYLTCK